MSARRYRKRREPDGSFYDFVSAVTVEFAHDGSCKVGMVTGSGHHQVTIPADCIPFVREKLS